ncbi:acyl-coenzyme A oxidase [Sediminihabitans luteus]|uniref:acyl-CoA oxidase n=1 Tax=Sediminihabitans luteus TaxID=1138585 RepID=A0A2M9D0A7_9CELL|nr:acyl-CoA dehydrogenase [Sediminihabitans luteus]PJJ77621.1 acyl-coenzyme A oxidase [Sediminihabitans luteus]GII98521.1 acyl-CoA dehydrogenase [Sediminihabitans luteus]
MTTTSDRPVETTTNTTTGTAGTGRATSSALHHEAAEGRVDVAWLSTHLLGRWADLRASARATAGESAFHKIEGQSKEEHRERVLEQCRALAAKGQVHLAFPERLGGGNNPGANLAGFEELVAADPSLQIKAGVQWGLFASAILHLGVEEQQDRLLPAAMDLSVPGAFAMTETGHGSDVAAVATTATYDPETQEFDLHTPFRAAWKDYLGNAAVHATAATVFAQLITRGVNHGVHCFYVPIREVAADGTAGAFLPGIGGEDDGQKGGLNGVDNGRLHFDHVRVPRADLLSRYGAVAEDGTYSSSIDSPGRRFFTMLGSLVQGRVSLDGAASNASKIGLQIAVTYANQRRQFAGPGTDEVVIMDYGTHLRRLLPRVAETYATHFAHDRLLDLFHSVFSGEQDTPETREDLETTAAALKATSTRFALDTLQETREACGGAGFLTENRITSLHADMDVYATFEGDNTVLLQLVGKRLLSDYARAMKGITPGGMARYVVEKAADAAMHRTPLRRAAQALADSGSVRRAAGHLREEETQRALLTERVDAMVEEVALALRPAQKADPVKAAEIFNQHQVALVDAAKAHADLLRWEAFTQALAGIEDEGTRAVLTTVRDLFGLTLVERNLAWYLINGRISSQRARTVTSYIDRLLVRLRPHAQDLVDAWGFGPEHLRAKIASGAEAERQDEARAYYRALRASGDAPVSEKSQKKAAKRA